MTRARKNALPVSGQDLAWILIAVLAGAAAAVFAFVPALHATDTKRRMEAEVAGQAQRLATIEAEIADLERRRDDRALAGGSSTVGVASTPRLSDPSAAVTELVVAAGGTLVSLTAAQDRITPAEGAGADDPGTPIVRTAADFSASLPSVVRFLELLREQSPAASVAGLDITAAASGNQAASSTGGGTVVATVELVWPAGRD